MAITFLTNEDKEAIIELLNNLGTRIDEVEEGLNVRLNDVEDSFNAEISNLKDFVGYDADNPDEGDEGDDGDATTIRFSVGDPDGGAESFTVPAGTTWQDFANSEDNLAKCAECDEDKPVVTISGGYVYCNCVIHTAEGVRRCADCEGSGNVYYFADGGDEITVKATDTIKATDYYCHGEVIDEGMIRFSVEGVEYSCLKGSTWRQLANPNAIGEEGIPTLDCTICGDPISPFVICVPDAYTGGTEVVVWRGEDGNCDTCCDENGMSLPTEATTWICDDYGCVEEFPDNKIIAGHNYVLDSCEN